MKRKVYLTCAVNGNAPVHPKYPFEYPVTPKQIADAVAEAAAAGASIAHIHVRDPKTGHGSREPRLFREVVDRIRQRGIDIVINLTAGMGGIFLPDPTDESRALPGSDVVGVEERIAHLVDCLPEIASLDVTTGNQEEGPFEFVYLNTTRTLRGMAKRFQELGVKPELEAFQAGDVLFANQLIKEGLIDGPPMMQFVLGVRWGAPADPETVLYMRNLLPEDASWTALGIAQMQMPMAAQSVLLGGHVRVGLEDNLYMERGVFATNGQLVERARQIIENLGCTVATPAETRELLKLKNF
ncbi:MAG: 3-keto-5-aminohexanoate cleavage protein [Gammaproteobacteria bacterium]|nr:3-keto-5-aminohexanoate cleavage protein [Gammaproteobacteria bacterium]